MYLVASFIWRGTHHKTSFLFKMWCFPFSGLCLFLLMVFCFNVVFCFNAPHVREGGGEHIYLQSLTILEVCDFLIYLKSYILTNFDFLTDLNSYISLS